MSEIINYASKYSNEIDERFAISSVTDGAVNKNYDFNGVNKVFVYSVDTAEVNDYSMSGTDRYGTPKELGNRVQELTLTQDKAFTFTIDRRNNDDTMMTMHAGRCLQRQIDEVIIPMMDKYRLEKLVEHRSTGIRFKFIRIARKHIRTKYLLCYFKDGSANDKQESSHKRTGNFYDTGIVYGFKV